MKTPLFPLSPTSVVNARCGLMGPDCGWSPMIKHGRLRCPNRILVSYTKLLLTKNYSEIIIFEKLRTSYAIPWKSPSFPEILRARTPEMITKNNSQGIIFVTISCQRVVSCQKLQTPLFGDRDRGGQNVPNARGGGETRPESCPSKTWTFDPQVGDFL